MKPIMIALLAFATGVGAGIGFTGAPETKATQAAVAPESVAANAPASGKTTRRVGLVAHDACKEELLAWVDRNAAVLAEQELFSTGTTGRLAGETLATALPDRAIRLTRFNSGPLGGDQQMGALIAEGGLDILFFFVDPSSAHPHDADIRALLRLCQVYNTVLATTPSTADFVIASPLFGSAYSAEKPDHSSYVNRTRPVSGAPALRE